MEQARLKNLAAEAEVSVATAFRALNGYPHVRESIRSRVREAAARLGYIPPAAARLGQVAVLVNPLPDASLSFYRSKVLGYLAVKCGERGLGMEVVFTDHLAPLEEHFLRVALIFQSTFNPTVLKDYPGTTVLSLNSGHRGFPGVATDEAQAVRLGLDYLCQMGHRRIAVAIPTDAGGSVIQARLAAYRTFCRKTGLTYRQVVTILPQIQGNGEWLEDIRKGKGAQAIFALGEDMLLTMHRDLHRLGVKVPQELSVLSFENDAAPFLAPAVTAVVQDIPAMVQQALDMAQTLLEGGKLPFSGVRHVPATLVARDSVLHITE